MYFLTMNNKHSKYYYFISGCLVFFLIFFLNSCIVVKEKEVDEREALLHISPKPEIALSEELVRSKIGDMIAQLPEGWFFVDISNRVSSNIFAVAVNPDYTLAAVFLQVHLDEKMRQTVEREDTFGLARVCLESHIQKTGGSVKQIGNFNAVNMGPNNFVEYEYSTTGGALSTKAAVFISRLNNYYEFALVRMNITGKPLPSKQDADMYFRSILTGIQY